MISPTDRPFELLKLIRDGVVKHINDLKPVEPGSYYDTESAIENLVRTGLVARGVGGELAPTPRLQKIFGGMRVSLTKLSSYSAKSVIATPIFGTPQVPLVKADILTVMPFSAELKPIYEEHIKVVVKELGLSVVRADDFFATSAVIADIWNAINAVKIIIADCTGRNPNVFYEIGIAHTLGKPVILLAQNAEDIPFDIQHLRALLYTCTPHGLEELERSLHVIISNEMNRPASLLDIRKLKK
jgi:hypothetical protein